MLVRVLEATFQFHWVGKFINIALVRLCHEKEYCACANYGADLHSEINIHRIVVCTNDPIVVLSDLCVVFQPIDEL